MQLLETMGSHHSPLQRASTKPHKKYVYVIIGCAVMGHVLCSRLTQAPTQGPPHKRHCIEGGCCTECVAVVRHEGAERDKSELPNLKIHTAICIRVYLLYNKPPQNLSGIQK